MVNWLPHTYPFWLVDQWTRPCLSECPWLSRRYTRPRGGGMEVVGQRPPPSRPLVRPTWSARQPCFPQSWPRPLSVAEGQGVRLALECIAVATHAAAGSSAWSRWLWCPKYPQCYSFLPAGDGPPERGKYIVIIDKAAQSSTLSFKKATQPHTVCRECLPLFNFHHFQLILSVLIINWCLSFFFQCFWLETPPFWVNFRWVGVPIWSYAGEIYRLTCMIL